MVSAVPAPPATTSPVTNRPLADALNVSLPAVPVMLSNVPVTALAVSVQLVRCKYLIYNIEIIFTSINDEITT